jgi:hypothetical protein
MKAKDPFALHGVKEDDMSMPEKTKDRIVVGAYVPRQLAELIATRAVLLGVPRTKVIEIAIEQYLKQNPREETHIIFQAKQRIFAEWETYKRASVEKLHWDPVKEFEKYKKQVITSLKKRGVSPFFSSQIKQALDNWYNN